jgi:UDP-N-acetylmuramoyl-L-alanyl-D-glutamate--2,6-diaminopimelate ligase
MMGFSREPKIMLSDLIQGLNLSKKCPRIAIKGMTIDSRSVMPGYLFVALKGSQKDGMQYIPQAIDRGAVAVLAEWDSVNNEAVKPIHGGVKSAIPVIGIEYLAQSLSSIAGRFYGEPSKRLAIVAITGTNGKTTCAQLYADLFSQLQDNSQPDSEDFKCGFVGTLGHGIARIQSAEDSQISSSSENVQPSCLTTPDAISMQGILAELASDGCSAVAIEASSHALVQGRISSVEVDTAVFTNLSRDHLDYHGDLNHYADAKRRLFKATGLKNAVINIDDNVGKSIVADLDPNIRVITYSLENITADIYCRSMEFSPLGFTATIQTPWGSGEVASSLLGKFNLYNLLAVIGSFVIQTDDSEYDLFSKVLELIPNLSAVSGRMELVADGNGPAVIVDYAHTPDALDKALQALKVHCNGALWVVFGCGGDRDIGKRAEMGKIASVNADKVVVTSDNPRTESAEKIIKDILLGTTGDIHTDADRRSAISFAIGTACKEDVILIAGKGHENYQILGTERLPFSDQAEARLALHKIDPAERLGGDL